MKHFLLGVLSVFVPASIVIATFFFTRGSHDGLIGVLGGGSSVFAMLLIHEIAKSR